MPNEATTLVRMTKFEKAALALLAAHFQLSENKTLRLLICEAAAGLQEAGKEQGKPMNSQETGRIEKGKSL